MSKPLKTAADLVALLNAELRKQDACIGVSVDGVSPVADKTRGSPTLETATVMRRSGGPVSGQCSRFFVAAVRLLQQQYDLAPEDNLQSGHTVAVSRNGPRVHGGSPPRECWGKAASFIPDDAVPAEPRRRIVVLRHGRLRHWDPK